MHCRWFSICTLLLITISTTHSELEEVVLASGMLGGTVELPCNTTPPFKENPVILVIWFREPNPNPIYSYDLRTKDEKGNHWYDSFTLGGRAFFNGRTNSSFLSIEHLEEKDRGRYKCRVDFDKAPARLHKVDLQVVVLPQPPLLLTGDNLNFRDTTYFEGSHLKVHCRVKGGIPAPRLDWLVNGRRVEGEPVLSSPGVLTAALDYGTLARKDVDNNISCSASNNNISDPVTTTASININLLPQQVEIMSSREPLSANKVTSITCTSWGSRPPAVITWWLGSNQLDTNLTQVSSAGEKSNFTESVLRFSPTRNATGMFLKCRAENPEMPASQIEDSWNIDINYPPVVTIHLGQTLDASRIKEGDDVYFECLIVSKPPVYKIVWSFNGREIKQNMREGIIMGNQSLVLQGLSKSSSGSYTCIATNLEGETESNAFNLDIKYKPICMGEASRVFGVARGEILNINCSVDANPVGDIKFGWSFNNTSETAILQESRFNQSGSISNLRYSPFHELDYGTLMCWATNQLGNQDTPCTFHIIPAGPPESVRGCSLNGSNSDNLMVNCEAGFDGGLEQTFQLEVENVKDGHTLVNQSSLKPTFNLGKRGNKKNLIFYIYSYNSKGMSERVKLPSLKPEVGNDPVMSYGAVILTDMVETLSTDAGEDRQDNNILSIILGVAAAVVLIVIVIIVTVTFRCGRRSNRNWGGRDTSGSSSPDLLVNTGPTGEGEFQCPVSRSISASSDSFPTSQQTNGSRSVTLPRRNHHPALLTLQSLPPPPPPPTTNHNRYLAEDLHYTELPPPPEWASTPLPPPDSFFTLPRKGGSNTAHQRTVRFHSEIQSKSITSLDRLTKSNSNVESIV